MPGPVNSFLSDDHTRLDALLARSIAGPAFDHDAYESFREGLLRHIGMEEKVLLPEARRRRNGEPLPIAKQLRADHSVLASLLVPTPTREIVEIIRGILAVHNQLEEGSDGAYAACERLAGAEAEALVARLRAVPPVPVAAHVDGPRVQAHIENLLRARATRTEADP